MYALGHKELVNRHDVLLGRVQVEWNGHLVQLLQQVEKGRMCVAQTVVVGIRVEVYMKASDWTYSARGTGSS